MALQTTTSSPAFVDALAVRLAKDVVRQMNRRSVALSALPKAIMGGKNCAWDVSFSGATAGTYTEGADVTSGDLAVDSKLQANEAWGYYRSAFGLSSLAKAVARSSDTSPRELVDMVAFDARGSISKIASEVNADCFNGAGTTGLIKGLDVALAATGSYGGLSKATYPEWAGNVLGNSGTARSLTKDLLDEGEQTVYEACGLMPDLYITTPAIARKYEKLFDSINRQIIVAPGELSAARQGGSPGPTWNPSAGETGLTYKGFQVHRDKDATAGHFYMLNSEHVKLAILPFVLDAEMANMVKSVQLEDLQEPLAMAAHFSALGKSGSSDRFLIEMFIQMVVDRVNANCLIEDIDES